MADTAKGPCIIGSKIIIRGSLTGSEDLVIEGRVEGTVGLKNHLTIEESGVVEADINVAEATINGQMRGDVVAGRSATISASAKVVGNVRAPRITVEDGARFKGSIEMDVELPEGVKASR